ncbi:serine/threonine-protein kinase [Streptomonospora nanhaiensis]|uniref:serine/threonine-protein kinase n=1 Tax=Streptomonospora nanhaiensis TaxID=1323731 RepID=UPI001C99DDC2|nr:serine/threonine-protein kinase [Streptomonospora nanhaiensis]MBX9386922.1 serine/threonine protein kinase [Streptomonospora nanhaiensis]
MNIGTVIDDRYELRNTIGHGSMGRVWLAHDQRLKRDVALKTMLAPTLGATTQEDAAVKRFQREARAVARLDHAGLAAVHDFGTQDGMHYIVMQFVQGKDLGDFIAEERRLSCKQSVSIAVQVCSVLAAAHAVGIVHRDLKPGNIRVRTDGVVKVLDFGVVALMDDNASKLTSTSETVGTLPYMAPEQIEGKPVDHHTDLYSLGCLLYEMLSGRPPFTHDSPYVIPRMHLEEEPLPLSALDVDVPQEVELVIRELLAKKPQERPRHVGEVYVRLAPFLPVPLAPEQSLVPWVATDPCRPFTHPMAPGARSVRQWTDQGRNCW